MARGTPDYNPSSSQYGQQTTDVAELAARMHSIDVLERKGSVYYIEDFSGLLAGWESFFVAGGSINPVANHAMRSPVVIKLVGASGVTDGAFISKRLPIIQGGRYGVEVMVSLGYDNVHTPSDFLVRVSHYTGSQIYRWQLWYKSTLKQFVIMTGDLGAPTYVTLPITLGDLMLSDPNVYYNYIKLVYDVTTPRYVRYIINNVGGDLSAYPPAIHTNTTISHEDIALLTIGNTTPQPIYYADLILTMDEP